MAIFPARRRFVRLALTTVLFLTVYLFFAQPPALHPPPPPPPRGHHHSQEKNHAGAPEKPAYKPTSFDWASRPVAHPLDDSEIGRLPEGEPLALPQIQHTFTTTELTASHNETQRKRREEVRDAARRAWNAYKKHAFGRDELTPLTLSSRDTYAGWGATLVDSLDTLWIMGLKDEFYEAVGMVGKIDWNKPRSNICSLFETNIRFLGGLLSAYDLSGEEVLLRKAKELGDMLLAGFDTSTHMPTNSFDISLARKGRLVPSFSESLAAAGSLSLEFTRLSQLTGDNRYYAAVNHVTRALARAQEKTALPGLWPVFIDLRSPLLTAGNTFSLGASADSAYEYLSKMYILLGGRGDVYEKLHVDAMQAAARYLLFRPMPPPPGKGSSSDSIPLEEVLFTGTAYVSGHTYTLRPEVQHLGCFAGGMFALGGRLFSLPGHVQIGKQIALGCAWAYSRFPTGIMPEVSLLAPCDGAGMSKTVDDDDDDDDDDNGAVSKKKNVTSPEDVPKCEWNQAKWEKLLRQQGSSADKDDELRLPKPWTSVKDPQYLLRPEAVESLFILWRVTGDAAMLDRAWEMWQSVKDATEVKDNGAFAAIRDVRIRRGEWQDSMEVSPLFLRSWFGLWDEMLTKMQSFWIAETLKYFFLAFSDPDVISLDDYVFNTEAHPFRIPKPRREDGPVKGFENRDRGQETHQQHQQQQHQQQQQQQMM